MGVGGGGGGGGGGGSLVPRPKYVTAVGGLHHHYAWYRVWRFIVPTGMQLDLIKMTISVNYRIQK